MLLLLLLVELLLLVVDEALVLFRCENGCLWWLHGLYGLHTLRMLWLLNMLLREMLLLLSECHLLLLRHKHLLLFDSLQFTRLLLLLLLVLLLLHYIRPLLLHLQRCFSFGFQFRISLKLLSVLYLLLSRECTRRWLVSVVVHVYVTVDPLSAKSTLSKYSVSYTISHRSIFIQYSCFIENVFNWC